MKYYLLLFILFCISDNAFTQQVLDNTFEEKYACVLPGIIGNQQLSRPYTFKRDQSNTRTLNFTINYLSAGVYDGGTITCANWPLNAKNAFDYAASIWSDVLDSDQNIGINACWRTNFPPGTILGAAGTIGSFVLVSSSYPPTYFPSALAEHILGGQLNSIDMFAEFNASLPNWHFLLDANPASTDYDFVTVVLHELGHGLGFFGYRAIDDGIGSAECDGVAGTGCIGRKNSGMYIPTMFDRHIDKITNGVDILSLPNPGTEIYSLLNGSGGGLTFDENNPCYFYEGSTNSPINLPNPYQPGSTYTHFDNSTFPNELMGPSLTTGKAIHDVGLAANVMYNIGWFTPTVKNLSDAGTGSLRSVMDVSCDGAAISFQGGLSGDLTLTSGQISIDQPLKISGPGSSLLSISGNNSTRIFNISNTGDLDLTGLTLKNAVESINGGAIFNNGGILTMDNVVLENNKQGATSKAFTSTASSTVTLKNAVTIKN